MRLMQAVIVAVLALGLWACSKPKQTRPDEQGGASTSAGGGVTTTGVDGAPVPASGADAASSQQQALAALNTRNLVYFNYDSSEIRSEYLQVVAAHAGYLAKFPTARVRLEGHTDERGSREYNIGLGERRAQAVKRALLLQGASEAQVATVSYGEERPAIAGGDESAYGQNRRVEIVHVQ